MRIFYVGNHEPAHSTESHIARALENNGHEVVRAMERPWEWATMDHKLAQQDAIDFALWTSTNDYAPPETFEDQYRFLRTATNMDIPLVGYHLDLWFGISRAHYVDEKPFFDVDLLCTADGGHQEEWEKRKIDHEWFPPAISRDEAKLGTFREEYASDIAFVGSWAGGYHRESQHRYELVNWLKQNYGDRCRFWPPKGQPSIRGKDLQDLYASTKVVVGDSCMVPHLKRYWSDRIPETTGRGAFLLHPEVEGLHVQHPHLVTWPAGNWSLLAEKIQRALEYDRDRQRIAKLAREDTILNHTYERRMEQLVETMKKRGLL